MRTLIFHSLRMRKVQTFSIMLTVALSVMILFALGIVYGGVQKGIEVSGERGGADIVVVPDDAASEVSNASLLFTGAPASIYFDAADADRFASIPGVERVTEQFYSQSLNLPCCSTGGETRIIGVDFSTDWTVQPFTSYDLSNGLAEDEVVVGSGATGDVGSQISLLGKTFTVVARLDPSGSDLDNSLLMNIDVAREISSENSGLSYLWQKYGDAGSLVSAVLVDTADGADTNRVITAIENQGGVTAVERSSVVESSQDQLRCVFAILLGAAVAMLVVTLVQLFARFYSCVWERKSELALYRAVGATKRQLRQLIIGEMTVITGVGVGVGLIAGGALSAGLFDLLESGSAFPFVSLSPLAVAGLACAVIVVFAVIGLVAIIMPLSQLSRLDPSLAMQQGDID
ncbi:MAG: ABC transporter permease [Eggerthellaceae bacterium]|jgi:putative ABC transport system permease protein